MKEIMELYEKLDGMEYTTVVKVDDEQIGLIAWDGRHGLHFFNSEGEETDYRSFGDFSQNIETMAHAQEAISDWVSEIVLESL